MMVTPLVVTDTGRAVVPPFHMLTNWALMAPTYAALDPRPRSRPIHTGAQHMAHPPRQHNPPGGELTWRLGPYNPPKQRLQPVIPAKAGIQWWGGGVSASPGEEPSK